ncbi:MAG: glycosyltransferase, partial [Planctomycetota bacterium]
MNTPFDSRLVSGVGSTGYVYERRHALLAPDADREEGPNIGSRGEHLTITFLSLNRASLSLRLLDSIARCLPDFRGEVLVVDNGSEPAELANLQAACRQQPFRCRLVELAENFGVAGGRNRTMSHVQTEWVLCLDNDTYFVANPLPAVQRALAVLGAHFLNLPLLDGSGKRAFARGGHLYVSVEGDQLYIGAGSAYPLAAPPAQPDPPFLSTFL